MSDTNKDLKNKVKELENIVSGLLQGWKAKHPEDFKPSPDMKLMNDPESTLINAPNVKEALMKEAMEVAKGDKEKAIELLFSEEWSPKFLQDTKSEPVPLQTKGTDKGTDKKGCGKDLQVYHGFGEYKEYWKCGENPSNKEQWFCDECNAEDTKSAPDDLVQTHGNCPFCKGIINIYFSKLLNEFHCKKCKRWTKDGKFLFHEDRQHAPSKDYQYNEKNQKFCKCGHFFHKSIEPHPCSHLDCECNKFVPQDGGEK